ncbi:MAG: FapA family protein [Treponema sp.]|nr:FapA family protein [Treponema sp.]
MASVASAKGSASISIDPQELEARLVFIPDPSGTEWDAAAVSRLAADKRLSAHPDPKALELFFQKAAKAKTAAPLELSLCQGIAPENPVSETISWEPLPIPGDMAALQKEALANAGPPVIFRTKVERIKHEKKVKKPGALPFMPVKEEIVVSWERKETREEVAVNPEAREIKYADKGTKLAVLSPSSPGKPGKSIFGRPIPPKPADEPCLLGKGIARSKNELSAMVSGFLRIGENWADMVPLSKPSWRINTGIDGLTLFFHFEPGDSRFAPPTGEEVLAAAASAGSMAAAADGTMVSAGELDKAIAEAVKHREPVEAFALFRTREAEARVDINPDKTRAVLRLRKGLAGARPLEMKAISQAIKDSGVLGFDAEKLKAAIHAFMEGKALVLSDYVLVEGSPSTRGKDREIQVEAALLSGEEQKQVLARLMARRGRNLSGAGEIDPSRATGFAFVEKNAVVATVSAASEGQEGKDIFGNVIPGLPGNDPDIKLFRGLELHGSSVTASQNGLLLMEASGKSFRGEVIDYRDAGINVHVSEDAMEARGDLFREEGSGVPLSVENVLKALAALGIRKGIDKGGIEKACALARARGSVSGYVFAKGEIPLAKGGSALTWLLPIGPPELAEASASREAAASTEAGASTDAEIPMVEDGAGGEPARNASAGTGASGTETVQVKAGTPIVEMSEPFAAGRPGYDVMGTAIPIEKATVISIDHDDSVLEVQQGKGKRLVAARSGALSFDGRELRISSVKTIQGDVGPATGNIKFSGEIQISGNVLPGFVVMGGSHVTVGGIAEGAFISAGGKAMLALGIKGGGKGVVRARAGIETAFAERASVMAVGDIKLTKGSILSAIKTNGKLYISSASGKLSGGVCQARQGIDAGDIGSEKGVRTEISFGQDYLLKDQIGVCEEEIAKTRRSLSEIEEKVKSALQKKLPLSGDVLKEKIRLVKLLEQLNLKNFTLREKFEEHHESEICIRGTVFPGVVIESHDRYYEVQQKRSRVIFYFDRESGRIKERPLGGSS